jgi:hypothetical protein
MHHIKDVFLVETLLVEKLKIICGIKLILFQTSHLT